MLFTKHPRPIYLYGRLSISTGSRIANCFAFSTSCYLKIILKYQLHHHINLSNRIYSSHIVCNIREVSAIHLCRTILLYEACFECFFCLSLVGFPNTMRLELQLGATSVLIIILVLTVFEMRLLYKPLFIYTTLYTKAFSLNVCSSKETLICRLMLFI